MNPSHRSAEEYKGLTSIFDRLPGCINRGVALLIRVSSDRQRDNTGSLGFQADQLRHLERFGVQRSTVRVFDATAESAKAGADRPVFRELLGSTQAGEVGLVVIADVDRAARDDPDGAALAEALSAVGGLLMVNGDFYDPADPSHRMILAVRVAVARFENDQRALRSITARLAKARNLEARMNLATGLLWGSPDDKEFVQRMEKEGLGPHLSPEALSRHRTKAKKDGSDVYVLPVPDSDAQHAYRLALTWIFESQDLNTVLERIATHPDWPRAGEFPVTPYSIFHEGKALVRWTRIIEREDGKDDAGKAMLYEWLRSPSLFGIYAFESTRVDKLSRSAAALGTRVWEEGAFPGLASPEDYERVREILRNPDRPKIRGSWTGPRNHFLAEVRCSHPMPQGRICGRKMSAMYASARDGAFYYLSVVCGLRRHRASVPQSVDAVVLDIVKGALDQERLTTELARIRLHSGADQERVRKLQDAVRTAEARVLYDDDRAFTASQNQNTQDYEFYETQRQGHARELASLRRSLQKAEADMERMGPLLDAEYGAILRLASDVPRLLALAERMEGRTRAILRRLIRRVHVRRLGAQIFQVDVEFPSGERVGTILVHGTIIAPQPVRALAHHRLKDHLPPSSRDTLAKEESAAAAASTLAKELNGAYEPKTKWTADRVFAAAYLWNHESTPAARRGPGRSITELARDLNEPSEAVESRALKGDLGPALIRNGILMFSPTEEELHVAFDAVALRDVALQQGWAEDDTAPLSGLHQETTWGWRRVQTTAEVGGGIVHDAAGRRYTRRSAFQIPTQDGLQRLLEEALPENANEDTGQWLTWAEAHRQFPGVSITTFHSHTAVVKPGFGEHGRRTVYIWVDRHVEALVHKPTLLQALERAGIALPPEDFRLRTEVRELIAGRFGFPSHACWTDAVKRGRIIEVRARTESCARLRAWAFVPEEVRAAEDPEAVRRFLAGAFTQTPGKLGP